MRRLAVPAALACLVMLALPGAVKASGVGREDRCPAGPSRVASYTEIEPSADGQSVGIDFALREGCEAVDVSLLSYHLVAGRTLLDSAEQVLYDVSTATVSAGRVNRLEVAVIPDCWSLVKLVVGRPPAGETDSGRIRAWDRRNTVHSRWRDGQTSCAGAATSPVDESGLLGALLQGPQPTTTPAQPGVTPSGAGGRGSSAAAGGLPGTRGATGGERSGGERFAIDSATAPGTAADHAGGGEAADPTGTAGAGAGHGAPADAGPHATGGTPAQVIAADGPLPLTGTNSIGVVAGSIGLVVAGTVLLRIGRRYRGRHLASS